MEARAGRVVHGEPALLVMGRSMPSHQPDLTKWRFTQKDALAGKNGLPAYFRDPASPVANPHRAARGN